MSEYHANKLCEMNSVRYGYIGIVLCSSFIWFRPCFCTTQVIGWDDRPQNNL